MKNLTISVKPKRRDVGNTEGSRPPFGEVDPVETTRRLRQLADEDIVHARSNTRRHMNKVSVLEGADGSPPF